MDFRTLLAEKSTQFPDTSLLRIVACLLLLFGLGAPALAAQTISTLVPSSYVTTNLARRVIILACQDYSHELQKPVIWQGWHAFRRSLATNLVSCGVEPKIIQAILRHSSVALTMDLYILVPDQDSRAAFLKIENLLSSQGQIEMPG